MRAPTIAKVVTAAKGAIMAYMTFGLHSSADPVHVSVSPTLADTASERPVIPTEELQRIWWDTEKPYIKLSMI